MRILLRAALLGLLSLTVFTTSASAECAWMLWVRSQPSDTFTVLAAYGPDDKGGAHVACERNRREAEKSVERIKDYMMFQCLPDTVDPRGPKGK